MGDMGELFREWNEVKKQEKEKRRTNYTNILIENNIKFISKNYGAHLIIDLHGERVDFWPGTNRGKYKDKYFYSAFKWILNKHKHWGVL